MLYHVQMTVTIPHDIDADYINEVKTKEKAYSQELQRQGKWVYIWRVVGKYQNISLFDVDSHAELHDILSNLPLFPYMQIEVTPLCKHYSSSRVR